MGDQLQWCYVQFWIPTISVEQVRRVIRYKSKHCRSESLLELPLPKTVVYAED